MTALVHPAPRRESLTASEHRQAAVRWARSALRPGAAVVRGVEATTPGSGAFVEIAIMETDITIRMNRLVNPWAPINPLTQRHHHLIAGMVAVPPPSVSC